MWERIVHKMLVFISKIWSKSLQKLPDCRNLETHIEFTKMHITLKPMNFLTNRHLENVMNSPTKLGNKIPCTQNDREFKILSEYSIIKSYGNFGSEHVFFYASMACRGFDHCNALLNKVYLFFIL